MSQVEKAAHFSQLHRKGAPLVLYNIWDAGGAKALVETGAEAVATGSWSMAAAHGYADGEVIPLDFVLEIVRRICTTVDVPVSVDFEGGYASDPDDVAENARRLIQTGAVGINFEDRIVKGDGLYPIADQAARIAAIKTAAEREGVPLFLNARTDLFLGTDPAQHDMHMADAMERATAYAAAGADCFFVPGLTDTRLIAKLTEAAILPVNVMMMGELTSIKEVAALGVSRASHGPAPYFDFLAHLKNASSGMSE